MMLRGPETAGPLLFAYFLGGSAFNLIFFFLRATPVANGSSQARG